MDLPAELGLLTLWYVVLCLRKDTESSGKKYIMGVMLKYHLLDYVEESLNT